MPNPAKAAATRRLNSIRQTQTLMYFSAMVVVGRMMPADERAALDEWDRTPGAATGDWPGWRKYDDIIHRPSWWTP
jgi:hypothetical protein